MTSLLGLLALTIINNETLVDSLIDNFGTNKVLQHKYNTKIMVHISFPNW